MQKLDKADSGKAAKRQSGKAAKFHALANWLLDAYVTRYRTAIN